MSSTMKFDFEKFDGNINFGLWQIQVKDISIQYELHKVLKGKLTSEGFEKSGKVTSKCKQFGHMKRDCHVDRASLAKGLKDCDVGSSSLNFVGDEDVF